MKKTIKIALLTLLALTFCFALTACDDSAPKTIEDKVQQAFVAISTASKITHTVEVKAGQNQVSLLTEQYVLGESGISMTGSKKSLNPNFVDDGNEFVTEQLQEQTIAIEDLPQFAPVNFTVSKDMCVTGDYTVTAQTETELALAFEVKPDKSLAVLNYPYDIEYGISNVSVQLSIVDGKATSLQINYAIENGNDVAISYAIQY